MEKYYFTQGDKAEAISIIREASHWLVQKGSRLWSEEELLQLEDSPGDEFIVMYNSSGSVAALTLSFEDSLFWPEIPAGESGFLHKIAVRRKFAGQGASKHIISHAEKLCREKGVTRVRLDCDWYRSKLKTLYESLGYIYFRDRSVEIAGLGEIKVSLYCKNI